MTIDYRFIFVAGVAGSGTTMLTRILSSPDTIVGLGGKYSTISASDGDAFLLVRQFNEATAELWDRKATFEQHRRAKASLSSIIDRLRCLKNYSHVVYKRSSPFFRGDRYRPDLSDLFDLFEDLRIIVIYRDPRAVTFSAFRRRHAGNLRQCAIICEEQLTYLSSQLATLDHSYRVIGYEDFCSRPEVLVGHLGEFCQLPVEVLLRAVRQEDVKLREKELWLQELRPLGTDFLSGFFNARRLSQWPLLTPRARPVRLY